MIIPISIGYEKSEFDLVSKQEKLDYVNSYSKESFSWEYNGEKIIISDEKVSVYGYPTVDNKYIIIYKGIDGQFKPPNNAVIYNLDGSIHMILEIPQLISERAKKYLEKEKLGNPPLELVKYESGLNFLSFGWRKNENGEHFNYISIQYDLDYGEGRELNTETGEIGRLIDDWYNYY
ncbi:hypothetical protein EG358_14715 [Chryseobacterium indoltheticum]|nr:hypothetical protein EG358_14715 [Chryseobacterium indoltheticum]